MCVCMCVHFRSLPDIDRPKYPVSRVPPSPRGRSSVLLPKPVSARVYVDLEKNMSPRQKQSETKSKYKSQMLDCLVRLKEASEHASRLGDLCQNGDESSYAQVVDANANLCRVACTIMEELSPVCGKAIPFWSELLATTKRFLFTNEKGLSTTPSKSTRVDNVSYYKAYSQVVSEREALLEQLQQARATEKDALARAAAAQSAHETLSKQFKTSEGECRYLNTRNTALQTKLNSLRERYELLQKMHVNDTWPSSHPVGTVPALQGVQPPADPEPYFHKQHLQGHGTSGTHIVRNREEELLEQQAREALSQEQERRLRFESRQVQELTRQLRGLGLEHKSMLLNFKRKVRSVGALKQEITTLRAEKYEMERAKATLLRPYTPRCQWKELFADYSDLDAYPTFMVSHLILPHLVFLSRSHHQILC